MTESNEHVHMSTEAHRAEAHAAAEAALVLAAELKTFRSEVTDLHGVSKRNRTMIRVLGVSFILDLLLSIGFGYVAIRAQSASETAAEANSAQAQAQRRDHVTCVALNDARAASRELWDFVLQAPTTPAESPIEEESRAETRRRFIDLLDRVSVQRNCTAPSG